MYERRKSCPNCARTLEIAFASVEKDRPKSVRTLRIANGNVEKSAPNGARTLRIASVSAEKSRPSGARLLPTCCLSDASRPRERARALWLARSTIHYMGARARHYLAARTRRRKTVSFLSLENGPCFGREGCVTLGSIKLLQAR